MVFNIISEKSIQKNDDVLYTEWVPVGIFVKIMVIFVCVLIASLGIVISVFMPEVLAFLWIIFTCVSLFIFLMYWNFRGLQIVLTNNQIDVKYGIFNHKRIPLKEITSSNITKARFRTYGGTGIRLGLDGSSAYSTNFGDAVKLTFQSRRPFVFSTKNPQKICELIKELSI